MKYEYCCNIPYNVSNGHCKVPAIFVRNLSNSFINILISMEYFWNISSILRCYVGSNGWVHNNFQHIADSEFGFARIFWIRFIVFAKRAKPTRKLLGLVEFRVCSYFLDLVCCLCGVHPGTFGFVRIVGLLEVWLCLYFMDLVFCVCGASRGHSETFGFVRIMGFF